MVSSADDEPLGLKKAAMEYRGREVPLSSKELDDEDEPLVLGRKLEDVELLVIKGAELNSCKGDELWDAEEEQPVKGEEEQPVEEQPVEEQSVKGEEEQPVEGEAMADWPVDVAASLLGMKSLLLITPTVRLTSSSVKPHSLPCAFSTLLKSTILSYRIFQPAVHKFLLKWTRLCRAKFQAVGKEDWHPGKLHLKTFLLW